MKNNTNNISSDDLCAKLNIKDVRSLLSTKGFPEPLFDKNKIMFNPDEVAKYFNVENLDEPFISLKEAAEYINISVSQLQSLIKKREVPFYRIKSTKGSGYLFRKSELNLLNDIKIEGNTDFINYFIGTDKIKELFMLFINEHFRDDGATLTEYKALKMYFLDRYNFEMIAEKFKLERVRVGFIFNRAVRRLKNRIPKSSNRNFTAQERELIKKDIEINSLKILLKQLNPEISIDTKLDNEKKERIFNFLNQDIRDEDLSTRALNCLRLADIDTVYDLLLNYNSFNSGRGKLLLIRNLGERSANEIIELIKLKENKLQELLGKNVSDFLLKNSDSPLFLQIHASFEQQKQINELIRTQNLKP